MTNDEIIDLVKKACNQVLEKDSWLLENDISEQSISHKIASYLQLLVKDYNVDCEYNGDIDKSNNKKSISILKTSLEEFRLLKDKECCDLDKELTQRAVFPDIIIHNRGTHKDNLCIIEVKKSTSTVSFKYDEIKLCSYTSPFHGNNLKYQIGIFIEALTKSKVANFNFKYYEGGYEVEL